MRAAAAASATLSVLGEDLASFQAQPGRVAGGGQQAEGGGLVAHESLYMIMCCMVR